MDENRMGYEKRSSTVAERRIVAKEIQTRLDERKIHDMAEILLGDPR